MRTISNEQRQLFILEDEVFVFWIFYLNSLICIELDKRSSSKDLWQEIVLCVAKKQTEKEHFFCTWKVSKMLFFWLWFWLYHCRGSTIRTALNKLTKLSTSCCLSIIYNKYSRILFHKCFKQQFYQFQYYSTHHIYVINCCIWKFILLFYFYSNKASKNVSITVLHAILISFQNFTSFYFKSMC